MNLETRVDKRLWDAIRNSLDNRNYTGAIQDSMYFLSELIRERSGLEGDGVSLIGQAFGGRNPALKVNKFKTENDKSIQNGIEHILRGLYQAIRNPRSHEKHVDSEEEAVGIIIFINYLIKIIDHSRPPFLESICITRVLDRDFVPKLRYAKLIVSEIPAKKRMDVFHGILKRISDWDGDRIRVFFNALFEELSQEELTEIYQSFSEILMDANDVAIIRNIIMATQEQWENLAEAARLRIENKLILSVSDGYWDYKRDSCGSGSFGTWASRIASSFSLKNDLLHEIVIKLESSDRAEQEYALRFFAGSLPRLLNKPTPRLTSIINAHLKNGDVRYKELVEGFSPWNGNEWVDPFTGELSCFEEKPLPFDPRYDDDIPF